MGLLPVIRQGLLAGLAEPGAILFQARQHDLVAVIHMSPAKPRDVAGTGVMPRLRRSRRGHQNQRKDEKKSGHPAMPSHLMNTTQGLYSVFERSGYLVRVKKTRPNKRLEPGCDSIGAKRL